MKKSYITSLTEIFLSEGVFSVSENKKVRFTLGNYTTIDGVERFAANPWEYGGRYSFGEGIKPFGLENMSLRLLSNDEWNYLIKTRPNAERLFAQARVNGVNGLMLLPDNFYEQRIRIPFDSTADSYGDNTYTKEQWSIFENAGCVFLPAAGYDSGNSLYGTGSNGYYWSSTFRSGNAWHLSFSSSGVGSDDSHYRYYGQSVRPVSEL